MRELFLRREIQKAGGDLVLDAQKLADETEFYLDEDFKENQIRNVINVAASSQSVPAVTNFIKFQIGRSKQNEGWRRNQ
jgi:hypothetical protein